MQQNEPTGASRHADQDPEPLRRSAGSELNQTSAAIREAGARAAKALHELAEARAAYAIRFTQLQAELSAAYATANDLDLQLARARALLEANGLGSEGQRSPRTENR